MPATTSDDWLSWTSFMFAQFGRQDITLTKQAYADRAMGGRVASGSPTVSTITGKIHLVTPTDVVLLRQGIAEVGDAVGIFYTSSGIETNDMLTIDGENWYVDSILGQVKLPNGAGSITEVVTRFKLVKRA